MSNVPITVAYGDGIGPEIMKASLQVLQEAGARLDIETIEIGEQVYLRGHKAGITDQAWDSLKRTKVFYKAPITTPQGGGYKSLNVTIRTAFGLFANVRPCASYYPAIDTKHPLMDVVIIRENEEDLYAGIEHRQTREVYQTLKLISRPGSEKIVRYAFEFARKNGRRKVTCFTKDNIMKMTDGTFHKVFNEIANDYPEIKSEHWIIDIGTAKLADQPEQFDVVVVPNLYGDILSDVAVQLTGSVGLGVSSNIGEEMAMFEAIHGSAPDIAGRGIANPSGLLLAAVPMLIHIGQGDVAETLHNAWLRTIEDGIHTSDIYREGRSTQRVNTNEFAQAVIARLGREPEILRPVRYGTESPMDAHMATTTVTAQKALIGVDVFLDWDENDRDPKVLGKMLQEKLDSPDLKLTMITNRGQNVYPTETLDAFFVDHWRCRFMNPTEAQVTHQQIVDLLQRAADLGLDFIKTEHLYTFDGEPAFSTGAGE
ncbi:NADP-dependent isocitrate dehydrogenase [Phototrophicus methaneseepsis]|uniref:Isocitrate dehydrogenase [NADP] n=1 Tax=Phototrophicus methaneseepsis TaxID=2710758 RepID=A0A7S8ECL2_9CHLR|nr:NADP-dependent isocitrate dehydrogenase [Phototrophicus methaneseepsis]QPC84379.1 NADP-dependent isocitrate dehydrogenase [Phototrophicus methaneseepsis]